MSLIWYDLTLINYTFVITKMNYQENDIPI